MGKKENTQTEQSYLLFDVWALMHSVGGLLDKALAGTGMSPDEFGFYSVIVDNQPITPKRISELVGMPPTTVSSFLSRLIAIGHISKKRNPADGRSFLIELTAEGLEALREAAKRFAPAQDAVIDQLKLPVEQVTDTLRQLTEAVQAATPSGA